VKGNNKITELRTILQRESQQPERWLFFFVILINCWPSLFELSFSNINQTLPVQSVRFF